MIDAQKAWKTSIGVSIIIVVGLLSFAAYLDWSRPRPDAEQTAEERQEQQKAAEAQARQATEDWVVSKLQYFKDPRTNLCFAYIWEGDYRGGLGLATVSCDRIPLNLLNTAHYRQWTDLGPTQQPAD